MILKGPSLLAVNLGSMTSFLRFLASSHTLSLMINGLNLIFHSESCEFMCS